jgi:hypothetical protein
VPDAGSHNLPDGGLCTPDLLDGGTVLLPRPDFGVVARWHGPADDGYRLGLQALAPVDGGLRCVFSFSDQGSGAKGDAGLFTLGADPADPCFCLPANLAASGALLWRVAAVSQSRAAPPAPNRYSDGPYGVSITLTPGPAGLGARCDGGCAQPAACP